MDYEPIRIVGIFEKGITQPRNDGTPGSSLYIVPMQLSRKPSADWAEVFVHKWDCPSQWSSMHRPGIAQVSGDQIIAAHEERRREEADGERAALDAHKQHMSETAKRIKFD